MAASDIGIAAIIIPNPQFNPPSIYAQVVNASIGYEYDENQDQLRTLSTNNPENNDAIKGLLYVPELGATDLCDNSTRSLIPRNVTRISDFPSELPLVAFAPWTSIDCVESFLSVMRKDLVQGAIFYHPDGSLDKPPPTSDPSWSLHDGGQWKSNPFPIYALPGAFGVQLMSELSKYSGAMIDSPYGPQLVKIYDSRNYVRLFARLDIGVNASIPSLWVFLIIVLAVLLAVVLFTSIVMHLIQARQRRRLQRRVAAGEVDLEALGIKRLNVPQSMLDKMPQYVYTTKFESTLPDSTASPVQRQALRTGMATHEVPFSQPTCPICLDDFEHNETTVRELPCSHIFHPECIDPFLRDNSSLCPMCKRSALPAGYCPVRVTNLMVRRERLVRRMRQRPLHGLEERDRTPAMRMSAAISGFGQRIRRASMATPAQRRTESPHATQLGPVDPSAPRSVPAAGDAPPPEVSREGRAARRAWRRQNLARAQERNFEEVEQQIEGGRPKWRIVVGRVFPGLA